MQDLTSEAANAQVANRLPSDGLMARGNLLFLENPRRYRVGEPLLREAGGSDIGL